MESKIGKMNDKQYSVLMSVYIEDKCEYVKLAIDSMLNQTVKPEQYVIVKDGKVNDDIEKLLIEYDKEYPNLFTIVKIKNNSGLANALNEGIKVCRNELVARMDADDISLPERCEKELEMFIDNPNLAVCGCNIDEFYDNKNNIKSSRVVPCEYEDIKNFGRKRQPFNHPTVMYKKTVIEEVGGYPDLRRKEDFDLFSRIIVSGAYVRNIDESLYLYRANINNYLRRKSKENMKAALEAYKLHRDRKGCGMFDYIEICTAEIIFHFLPIGIMKVVSDKILRK